MSEHKPRTRQEICEKAGRASAMRKRSRLTAIRAVALHCRENDPGLAQLPAGKFERIVKAAYRLAEADDAMRRAVEGIEA